MKVDALDHLVINVESVDVTVAWYARAAKTGARGTLRSVYCRDPDGSLIEISSYEDGGAAT